MDYFQSVVTEFLRADRSTFVNPECLIQLETGIVPAKGRSWYCDILAVSFRDSAIYLCEVSYSTTMNALCGRLRAWAEHWPEVRAALVRDCKVPATWKVQPWLFVPNDLRAAIERKLPVVAAHPVDGDAAMPAPRVTTLEEVVPWTEQYKVRAYSGASAKKPTG